MRQHTKRKEKEWQAEGVAKRLDRSKYVAGPSASPEILQMYNALFLKVIQGRKREGLKVVVLGATPETRDLVLRHGCQLYTIDISMEAILKFSALMKNQNSNREIILKADWLESPLPDRGFDLIIGDGVFNNVRVEDWPFFARQIRRQLKPNGYLILRENLMNPRRQRQAVEAYDHDFRTGKVHWFDLMINLYFYSDLTRRACDFRKKRCYMTRFFKLIEKCYTQGRLSRKAFEALWWFRGNLIHSFINRDLFRKVMCRYFRALPVAQARDPYQFTKDTFCFYLFKPKR